MDVHNRKSPRQEADLGRVAGARDQLGEPSDGEWRAPLGNKNEGRLGFTFQGPQRPHFVTKQRMRSCCFALGTDEMAMVSPRLIASVTETE